MQPTLHVLTVAATLAIAACGPGSLICDRGTDTSTDSTPLDVGTVPPPPAGGTWGPCVAGSPPTCDEAGDTCYLEADGPDLLSLCVPPSCGAVAEIAGGAYVLDEDCHPVCDAPEDCASNTGFVCGDDGVCAWISATP